MSRKGEVVVIHRAAYVFVEPGRLLQDAAVHITESGWIIQVESRPKPSGHTQEMIDWGSSVILPGLVNAHTHLELTSLHDMPVSFNSFADWLAIMAVLRRSWTDEDYAASVRKGSALSLSSGTTLVGDISSSSRGWTSVGKGISTDEVLLRRVVFGEMVSLASEKAGRAVEKLEQRLFRQPEKNSLHTFGISPHAPYSVSAELYRRAAGIARTRKMLLTTHAAETRAELEFLKTGTGELRDFMAAIDALPAEWTPPGLHPVAYLHSLGILGKSCLLAHCNYLDDESINVIAATGSSVVYCPRSHGFFGHDRHPVRRLLDAGINVALGTDSLASNHSLSMLDEVRYLFRDRKDLNAEEIFRAATANGAAALHLGDRLGSLKEGYRADMTVLKLPDNAKPRQLLHQVLEGAGSCTATIVDGHIAWSRVK
jgi:aminodeoxyfutalosine deaminase